MTSPPLVTRLSMNSTIADSGTSRRRPTLQLRNWPLANKVKMVDLPTLSGP